MEGSSMEKISSGIKEMRAQFEGSAVSYEKSSLRFRGAEGYDVYNTSIPFWYQGLKYLFGRVERREEWARSVVKLFKCAGDDIWEVVPDAMAYQMEDPFVMELDGEIVLGGTRVDYSRGKLSGFCGVFYKGKDLFNLHYYTTGPRNMKDIRLVKLADGRLGVFSRPRGEQVRQAYGSEAVVGFTVIDDISGLDERVLEQAEVIEGLFETDEWGGCNQCLLLEDGRIGVIGHQCYYEMQDGIRQQVYLNISFVFNPESFEVSCKKVIGTSRSYPAFQAKREDLKDCAFPSGILRREDGKFDLYSGIGDTAEGRIVIDNPFGAEIEDKKSQLRKTLAKVNKRMQYLTKGERQESCPIGIIDFDLWEWPQGVGLYGMFQYYKETGEEACLAYLEGWYARQFQKGLPEKNVNTMAPMLTLAHLYEATSKEEYLTVCREWAAWVMEEMPRTEEGGLQHIVTGEANEQQLWDDTLFMTVLFLGKMGMLLNKEEYKEESYYQFLIHIKYLYDTHTGLWFHGWSFLERNHFAEALWARGNCWITAGIPDYIEMMELTGARKRYLVQTLETQVKALVQRQCEDGMWTTLLDDPHSYEETSAAAGFAYGILKAVRLSLLDRKYSAAAVKAVAAVLERTEEDGTVTQVSYGTGMGKDLEHYRRIPICPMAYGQALAILMLNEAIKTMG